MRPYLLLVLITLSAALNAQQISIIPKPVDVIMPDKAGKFVITAKTPLVLQGSGMENSADFLNNYLQKYYGFKLKVVKTGHPKNAVVLNYERLDSEIPGAYTLDVKPVE